MQWKIAPSTRRDVALAIAHVCHLCAWHACARFCHKFDLKVHFHIMTYMHMFWDLLIEHRIFVIMIPNMEPLSEQSTFVMCKVFGEHVRFIWLHGPKETQTEIMGTSSTLCLRQAIETCWTTNLLIARMQMLQIWVGGLTVIPVLVLGLCTMRATDVELIILYSRQWWCRLGTTHPLAQQPPAFPIC